MTLSICHSLHLHHGFSFLADLSWLHSLASIQLLRGSSAKLLVIRYQQKPTCAHHAGITGISSSCLVPILGYLQEGQCIYTHNVRLRQGILQLLHATVSSAPNAAQHQRQQFLMLLLRVRSSMMLDTSLDRPSLDQVSVAGLHAGACSQLPQLFDLFVALSCALGSGCTHACRMQRATHRPSILSLVHALR